MLTRVGTPQVCGDRRLRAVCSRVPLSCTQWMAPEVLRNDQYNEKADVFSYGCVLWELYTRQDPYKGMNAMEVGKRVVTEGLRLPLPANSAFTRRRTHTYTRTCRRCSAADPRDDDPSVLGGRSRETPVVPNDTRGSQEVLMASFSRASVLF